MTIACRQIVLPWTAPKTEGKGIHVAGTDREFNGPVAIEPNGHFQAEYRVGKELLPGQYEVFFYMTSGNLSSDAGPMSKRLSFDVVRPDQQRKTAAYTFTFPQDVTFASRGDVEFYTFNWGEPPLSALLMLNVSPVPLAPREFRASADTLEGAFEAQMKELNGTAEIVKKRADVELGPFKGIEIEFTIKHSPEMITRQYMLLLHDGERAWNGQLTATSTHDIAKAHSIIGSAKRIESKAVDRDKE
jgi:hypothetical protein